MREASDLSLRGLAVGAGIIVAGIAAALLIPLFLAEPRPPVDGKGMTLQTAPAVDFSAYEKEKTDRLRSRGPIEGDPSHVHIPIEQAMQMMVEGGRK